VLALRFAVVGQTGYESMNERGSLGEKLYYVREDVLN
jgi:hypothetical protein